MSTARQDACVKQGPELQREFDERGEGKRQQGKEDRRVAEEKLRREREERWLIARRHVARVELAQRDACASASQQDKRE